MKIGKYKAKIRLVNDFARLMGWDHVATREFDSWAEATRFAAKLEYDHPEYTVDVEEEEILFASNDVEYQLERMKDDYVEGLIYDSEVYHER